MRAFLATLGSVNLGAKVLRGAWILFRMAYLFPVRAVLQMQIETHSLTLVIHCECRGAQVAACFAFTFTQSQRDKQRLSVQKGAMNDVMKEARGTTQIGRHGVSFEAALVGAVRVRRSRVA